MWLPKNDLPKIDFVYRLFYRTISLTPDGLRSEMQLTAPDYATRFDSTSLSACFLALNGAGNQKRHATGFFWRRNDSVFLITNWHVVTGISPLDGKQIASGWCPESLSIEYFTKVGPNDLNGMRSSSAPTVKVALYEDFHEPFWIQHKMTSEWGVDIVALRIDKEKIDPTSVLCVNDRQYPQLLHFAGSEVFVLGHPLPKSTTTYPVSFPVWKRGSIASELIIPWNMRPAFLIDSRTSNGMSGSPVFSKVFGPAAHSDLTIHTDNIMTSEFLGVYSGRLHDDENNASLGLVWHRGLIDAIIDSPSSGSREWIPSKSQSKFSEIRQRSS